MIQSICKYWPIYNIGGKTCLCFGVGVMFIWFHRITENWVERAWRDRLNLPHSILNKETKMRFYMHIFPEIWTLPHICMPKHCTNKNRALVQRKGACEDICDFCVHFSWWTWPQRHSQNQPKTFTLLCHYSDGHQHYHRKKNKPLNKLGQYGYI